MRGEAGLPRRVTPVGGPGTRDKTSCARLLPHDAADAADRGSPVVRCAYTHASDRDCVSSPQHRVHIAGAATCCLSACRRVDSMPRRIADYGLNPRGLRLNPLARGSSKLSKRRESARRHAGAASQPPTAATERTGGKRRTSQQADCATARLRRAFAATVHSCDPKCRLGRSSTRW